MLSASLLVAPGILIFFDKLQAILFNLTPNRLYYVGLGFIMVSRFRVLGLGLY